MVGAGGLGGTFVGGLIGSGYSSGTAGSAYNEQIALLYSQSQQSPQRAYTNQMERLQRNTNPSSSDGAFLSPLAWLDKRVAEICVKL